MNTINAKTELYVLIGDPVEHSLSPVIHNSAFATLGMNAVYLAVQVRKERLKEAVDSTRALGVKGMNVTMPHKTEIIKHLDGLASAAEEIGAVNTVVNRNGKLIGHNTDAEGALAAIKNKVKTLRDKKAVVLGSGGAARAVCWGLAKEGCQIVMLARNVRKAKEVARNTEAEKLTADNLSNFIPKSDLLCNCTPIGMHRDETPVPKNLLRRELVVFDSVYKVGGTKLIADANSVGCTTVGGEEMLVNQAIASLGLWTMKQPDRDILLSIVREELGMQASCENIFLIGFMGSGKSSVGRALARKLKMGFVDTDSEIERMAGKRIKEIFAENCEETFRQLEMDAVHLASRRENCIIAVGGGAVLNHLNIQRMRSSGRIVLLRASPETIIKRLEGEEDRPLLLGLTNNQRLERINELLKIREPLCQSAKDIEVDTDKGSTEEIASRIVEALGVVV
ncbi:shikimate dehydrogenase [Candidatus Micrarchaeota archaeon]|nr:shikimate dehydrogenase [Candidatus Micrarchaeota archaeon]